ncbi:MAG TPA: vWA domain-containing protein [Pirellulales bacterium]|nr:vWA domain-containing protein [Pirellulales bacterium]
MTSSPVVVLAAGEPPTTTTAAPVAEPGGQRRFLPPNALRFSAAVCCSTVVHMALVIALALWFFPEMAKPRYAEIEATVLDRPDELLNQVLETEVEPTKELALVSASPLATVSGNVAIHGVSQPKLDRTVAESTEMPSATIGDVENFTSAGSGFNSEVPEGTYGEPQAIVDSYQEAMDRITHEILHMLSKGKVLVIWCFDQSESMKDDQEEIRSRIERVYSELGLSDAARGDALFSAVTSYGEQFKIHTPKPTADLDEIRDAIGEVPIDKTGKEMMCLAVGSSIAAFHKYATSGRRQLALILVTDESGEEEDNFQNLESAVQEARSTRCTVFALGREAVFGYPYCYMNWIDPKTKIDFWLRINRGPETPRPEQLQIDGFTHRWDAHASGFGPYEQVRLARETGGAFFMLPSPEVNLVARDNRKYELERMRPYLPDLSPRTEYEKQRDKSKLRSTLWQVILDLNPYHKENAKRCTVRVTFPIDPQEFAKLAVENEQTARGMLEYLKQAEKTLDKVKPLRSREKSFRWQANYDLMYAQVVAYQVRIQEYAAYLADCVKHPKEIKNPLGKDKPTTHWDIRTRAKMITGGKTKEDVDRATALLKEVVRLHPGTPYAARAEWELHRGFGVELVERFYDPRRGSIKVPNL